MVEEDFMTAWRKAKQTKLEFFSADTPNPDLMLSLGHQFVPRISENESCIVYGYIAICMKEDGGYFLDLVDGRGNHLPFMVQDVGNGFTIKIGKSEREIP